MTRGKIKHIILSSHSKYTQYTLVAEITPYLPPEVGTRDSAVCYSKDDTQTRILPSTMA